MQILTVIRVRSHPMKPSKSWFNVPIFLCSPWCLKFLFMFTILYQFTFSDNLSSANHNHTQMASFVDCMFFGSVMAFNASYNLYYCLTSQFPPSAVFTHLWDLISPTSLDFFQSVCWFFLELTVLFSFWLPDHLSWVALVLPTASPTLSFMASFGIPLALHIWFDLLIIRRLLLV